MLADIANSDILWINEYKDKIQPSLYSSQKRFNALRMLKKIDE